MCRDELICVGIDLFRLRLEALRPCADRAALQGIQDFLHAGPLHRRPAPRRLITDLYLTKSTPLRDGHIRVVPFSGVTEKSKEILFASSFWEMACFLLGAQSRLGRSRSA